MSDSGRAGRDLWDGDAKTPSRCLPAAAARVAAAGGTAGVAWPSAARSKALPSAGSISGTELAVARLLLTLQRQRQWTGRQKRRKRAIP